MRGFEDLSTIGSLEGLEKVRAERAKHGPKPRKAEESKNPKGRRAKTKGCLCIQSNKYFECLVSFLMYVTLI